MLKFERDYKIWEEKPNQYITRQNVMSFIVWSFWDSRGKYDVQYARLLQLRKIETIKRYLKKDFTTLFTVEERAFAAEIFNSLSYVDPKGNDGIHETEMSSEDAGVRLQQNLAEAVSLCEQTERLVMWKSWLKYGEITLRELPGQKKREDN